MHDIESEVSPPSGTWPPESGQHLKAKSGLGLPTTSLMMSVMTPLRGMASVTTRDAEVRSTTSLVIKKMMMMADTGTRVTQVHSRLLGT